MKNLIPIEAIQERDIDLLLLEEFYCSEDFRGWFIKNTVGETFPYKNFGGAWHSLTHAELGESDIVVKYVDRDKKGYFFLIENKIDALFQPDQAKRYQQRGKEYIERGECVDFAAVLVAPGDYIENNQDFDFVITYEHIRDWFIDAVHLKERGKYKVEVLKAALEKYRRGYQPIGHEPTTLFWKKYWQLCGKNAPELGMKEPRHNIPAGSSWFYFHPDGLEANYKLCHKGDRGFVDLQLSGKGNETEELKKQFKSALTKEMAIVKANKSAAIRIKVDKIDVQGDFDSQSDKIINALEKSKELVRWSKKNLAR